MAWNERDKDRQRHKTKAITKTMTKAKTKAKQKTKARKKDRGQRPGKGGLHYVKTIKKGEAFEQKSVTRQVKTRQDKMTRQGKDKARKDDYNYNDNDHDSIKQDKTRQSSGNTFFTFNTKCYVRWKEMVIYVEIGERFRKHFVLVLVFFFVLALALALALVFLVASAEKKKSMTFWVSELIMATTPKTYSTIATKTKTNIRTYGQTRL
jgi:hypothetical protein